jgi:hypothetical protein
MVSSVYLCIQRVIYYFVTFKSELCRNSIQKRHFFKIVLLKYRLC